MATWPMIWKAKTNKKTNKQNKKTALLRVSGEILLIPKEGTQESKPLTSTERYHSRYNYRNCSHHPINQPKNEANTWCAEPGDCKEKEPEP